MPVFFANITGKRLIIRHYQLYQPLPVKLDKSCLYLSWSFYICDGRFILANFFYIRFGRVIFAVVVLYQPIFFIFVLVVLYLQWSFYISQFFLYSSWSCYICGGRFILSNFFKYLSWSCYICMDVLYQPFFIFVSVVLYLPWPFYINFFFLYLYGRFILAIFYIRLGCVIFAMAILY